MRAAPTSWEVEGRVAGAVDLPVCETHEAEIAERLDRLDGTELSVVLAAPDPCSGAVAGRLAGQLGCKSKTVDEIGEVSLGLWEGLRVEELESKHPRAFKQWSEDLFAVSPPNAEPAAGALDRVLGGLSRAIGRVANPEPGVGVVVRPGMFAILRAWGGGTDARGDEVLWSANQTTCDHVWMEVATERLTSRPRKVGA